MFLGTLTFNTQSVVWPDLIVCIIQTSTLNRDKALYTYTQRDLCHFLKDMTEWRYHVDTTSLTG